MKKSLWVLTSSLICFTATDIFADAAAQPSRPQTSSTRKMSCMQANNPHRIDIKHIEAKGIGYNQGYTSLDGFFTSMWNNFVPFLDLRAHVFNNGRWAANAGLGTRYIFDPCQWMVGGNVYYDYRSTKHGHYHQIGAGAEAFYDRFEAHLNGYLPVGQKRRMTKKHIESVSFKGFSGNYILQNEHYDNSFEGAMKGFNGEVGAHIAGDRKCYDLYFGVGPYYYDVSSGKHAWGGKARLKAEVTKYLFLEVSDSYDRIFHNRLQGTVNVSIPFGGKLCYPSKSADCSNVMDWQAVLPVERQEIIVVSKFKKKHTVDPVAINPATGQPFFVLFVNNTNTALGDGTYENPFSNLTSLDDPISAENAALDGNIIYVFTGDGSSTGMSGGNMQLNPGNRLLGSANSHPFQTTQGLLTVPALTATKPNVQGPNTNHIILMASDCEVSGLNISFPTFTATGNGMACITALATVSNVNVNNNNVVNETYGIALPLSNAGGRHTSGSVIIANNTSSGHGNGFAYTLPNSFDGTLTLVNNVATNNVNGTTGWAIALSRGITCNLFDNVVEGTPNGFNCLDFNAGVVPQSCTLKGNTTNNTSGYGFLLEANVASKLVTYIVDGNTFINTGVQSRIVTNAATTICARFNNNVGYPSQVVGNPFLINAASGGTIQLEAPLNNFPQPSTSGTTSEPACFCAPCN